MTRPFRYGCCLLALGLVTLACVSTTVPFVDREIETGWAFVNLSQDAYAALAVREHGAPDDAWVQSPLLAPGARHRARFRETLGVDCPAALDLAVWVYERVDNDLPIGLDDDEAVNDTPLVAGQVFEVPACGVQVLETFTVVNWDAPPGTARLKIAQNTLIDAQLRESDAFGTGDSVWEINGVNPDLPPMDTPPLEPNAPIEGRVTTADGAGVEGVVVLLRTRYRLRLDDDPDNDPDAGWSLPIDFMVTPTDGRFSFARPPGAYQVEFASDDYAFRPGAVELETPSASIVVIAEPIP